MNRLLASSVILIVPVLSNAHSATAQIQPGRIYTGGEEISDPESGLKLTLPAGWRGRLSPDGESFLMESEVGGGYMVVTGDVLTEAEARQQMTDPVDLGDGVVLTLNGDVETVASGHLAASYSVTGPPTAFTGAVEVRLTQTGFGVAFILLSPPDAAASHREALREFAFSLGVGTPVVQTPGAAGASGGGDEWQPYLRGLYVARYFTGSSYTESTELWLCSDGSFYYNSQGGGFGGGASGAVQGLGQGRWSATGAGATGTLILDWSSGSRTTLDLGYDYEQNRMYVNGDRWLRGNNERCR